MEPFEGISFDEEFNLRSVNDAVRHCISGAIENWNQTEGAYSWEDGCHISETYLDGGIGGNQSKYYNNTEVVKQLDQWLAKQKSDERRINILISEIMDFCVNTYDDCVRDHEIIADKLIEILNCSDYRKETLINDLIGSETAANWPNTQKFLKKKLWHRKT